MSKRAEKRALELFPVDMQMCIDNTGKPYEADVNAPRRKYVAFGYEQAEKDVWKRIEKYLSKRNATDLATVGWILNHIEEYKKKIMEKE